MSQVTNETLLNAILELKGDVGTLIGKVESQGTNLASHIVDDEKMQSDISTLKLEIAEKRGITRIMHAASGLGGSAIGAIATILARHHGN